MARMFSAFRLGRVIGRGLIGPVSGRIARYAVRRAVGNRQWVPRRRVFKAKHQPK